MYQPNKKKYTKCLCGGHCSLTVNLLNCKSNSWLKYCYALG